jgi:hypothetical protein
MLEVKLRWSRHERQWASLVDPGVVPDPPLLSDVTLAVDGRDKSGRESW